MRTKKPVLPPEPVSKTSGRLAWWHVALGGLIALAAAYVVYGPALNGPFVFDDQYLPFFSARFGEQTLVQASRGVRPLLMFTFWLNNQMAGTEPFQYHLWNLLLHVADSLLVFFIVRKILEVAGSQGGRREWMSAFAGAVFLLHPVQTEAVSYVASRSENLSAFFFYAAMVVFLYRRRAAVSWLGALAVIALYGAAVSTKEHTITLIGLLLLTDYFWNPGFSFEGIRRNWRLYGLLVLAAVGGVALTLRLLGRAPSAGFYVPGLPWYDYFYTQCRALWVYFRLFLLPVNQNADYAFPISRSLFEAGTLIGLAGLLILVGAAWYFRKRFRLAAYGVLAALLMFSPTSSVIPILDAVAERRLYLPMLGLVFVAVEVLNRWKGKPRPMQWVSVAVLVVLAVLCFQRNQVWASDVTLWENVIAGSPGNSRAQFQLGVAYYGQRRCQDALRQYETVSKLIKPGYSVYVDWAMAEDCVGRPDEAIARLQQALAIRRGGHASTLMGMIYGKQKKYAEALAALDAAEKVDASNDMTYFYRGNVLAVTGEPLKALDQYRRALQLNPDNAAAARAIARMEARMQGR